VIVFHTLRYKNFLSTGNVFTEIVLDKDAHTLIVGTNGAGKSTILEALCFALFGKAFRRINKPNLVNSINGKNLVVELEFTAAGKRYRIVRGVKPAIFEIYKDGNLVDQNASRDYQAFLETTILKMNFKSFTQIVILGAQSFTPFMQLAAADRRSIIEDLLDIQIFSIMNIIAKQKMQSNREVTENTRTDIRVHEEKKLLIERTLNSIIHNNDSKLNLLRVEMKDFTDEKEGVEEEIIILNQQMESLFEMVQDEKKLKEKHRKFIGLQSQIQSNLERHRQDIEFYHINDNCPTCHQIIETAFKETIITSTDQKVLTIQDGLNKLTDEISKVIDDIVTVDTLVGDINEIKSNISTANANLKNIMANIARIERSIEELNQADSLVSDRKLDLKDTERELTRTKKGLETLLSDRSYLELILSLLKDGGIKTKIIKQYLPIINKQINKYLGAMDFFINFELDDNFNESIKSRHRDEFQYGNFSNGERMRLDLAILFTWRTVARMRNSVSTNLLILDEVFDSSLDTNGVEEFIKIIKTLVGNTNVFIISHKGDQLLDKFDKVIRFDKVKGFSRMIQDDTPTTG